MWTKFWASLKHSLELTKPGILFLVLVCAGLGYALGIDLGTPHTLPAANVSPLPSHSSSNSMSLFLTQPFFHLMVGLLLLSGGSLALNQAQEWAKDLNMARTARRPIPSGRVKPTQAFALSWILILLGLWILYELKPVVAVLGLVSAVLYNGLYTLYWKPRLAFAAVPGALPGAMPVLIGYAASSSNWLRAESIYVFLIMFVWQMPHFWSLAIRYADDYRHGGFPVLPVRLGFERTLFHMGLYTLLYVALAASAPWFVHTGLFYFVLVLPLAFKVLLEFWRFQKKRVASAWLPFFLWVNFSLLGFLASPVLDKWFLKLKILYFS